MPGLPDLLSRLLLADKFFVIKQPLVAWLSMPPIDKQDSICYS